MPLIVRVIVPVWFLIGTVTVIVSLFPYTIDGIAVTSTVELAFPTVKSAFKLSSTVNGL